MCWFTNIGVKKKQSIRKPFEKLKIQSRCKIDF